MADLAKLNWNEVDGSTADVNDIKPIANKVDDILDRHNPLYAEVIAARGSSADLDTRLDGIDTNITFIQTEITNARGGEIDLDTRLDNIETNVLTNTTNISSNDIDIANLQAAQAAGYNCKGEFVPGTTSASKWDMWRYNNKFWISREDSNAETPSTSSSKWYLWDNISDYVLITPTVTTSNINENTTGTHTISNYDSDATYSVSSSDSLISSISVSGNTVSITTGNITDDTNHTGTYTVEVRKAGYLYSTTTITFTIVYVPIITDDALLWEGTTYADSYFDKVSGGAIA